MAPERFCIYIHSTSIFPYINTYRLVHKHLKTVILYREENVYLTNLSCQTYINNFSKDECFDPICLVNIIYSALSTQKSITVHWDYVNYIT